MNENIDYTIGDDIVCIKTHSQNLVKEGDMYVVFGIKHNNCTKCGGILVDVGIKDDEPFEIGELVQCHYSHGIPEIYDGKLWFSSTLFKKLDTLVNITELTEVLERPIFN